jgi:hypothetical protein
VISALRFAGALAAWLLVGIAAALPQTANALNHVSWSALFARTPGEALNASERAHTLAPASLVIETNRAHALLFLGRSREAGKIYLAHKGKWLRREGRGVQCRSIRFEMPSPMNNAS